MREGDSQGWNVYVGARHDAHLHVWNRFRVDRRTGDIRVVDAATDERVPLKKWQDEQRDAGDAAARRYGCPAAALAAASEESHCTIGP